MTVACGLSSDVPASSPLPDSWSGSTSVAPPLGPSYPFLVGLIATFTDVTDTSALPKQTSDTCWASYSTTLYRDSPDSLFVPLRHWSPRDTKAPVAWWCLTTTVPASSRSLAFHTYDFRPIRVLVLHKGRSVFGRARRQVDIGCGRAQ